MLHNQIFSRRNILQNEFRWMRLHFWDRTIIIKHKLIPKLGLNLEQTNFLHFEKYDERFHWNRSSSIIELWIPLKN
jgi:hypothetical protein